MTIWDNEGRADLAERMLTHVDTGDPVTMITDAIANLMHYCDRHGLHWLDMLDKAEVTYYGDMEDGPKAARLSSRTDDPAHAFDPRMAVQCAHCEQFPCNRPECGRV